MSTSGTKEIGRAPYLAVKDGAKESLRLTNEMQRRFDEMGKTMEAKS